MKLLHIFFLSFCLPLAGLAQDVVSFAPYVCDNGQQQNWILTGLGEIAVPLDIVIDDEPFETRTLRCLLDGNVYSLLTVSSGKVVVKFSGLTAETYTIAFSLWNGSVPTSGAAIYISGIIPWTGGIEVSKSLIGVDGSSMTWSTTYDFLGIQGIAGVQFGIGGCPEHKFVRIEEVVGSESTILESWASELPVAEPPTTSGFSTTYAGPPATVCTRTRIARVDQGQHPPHFDTTWIDLDVDEICEELGDLSTTTGEILSKEMSMFPNPCSETSLLRGVKPNTKWSVVDMSGRKVLEGRGVSVEASMLPSGSYMLSLVGTNQVLRFVRE